MQISSGLLMYHFKNKDLFVLLAHPGGPFGKKKDLGIWDIPKGGIEKDEELFETARREFSEETGITPPAYGKNFFELGSVKYSSGKIVHVWAFETKEMPKEFRSNYIEIEWPPRSGKKQKFPEKDKWEFFNLKTAREKILPSQLPFLARLEKILSSR